MEWEQTGSPFPWLGEYTTLNTGVSPSVGAASVSWLTSTGYQHLGCCLTLNLSEQPRTANPTKLSEILVTNPDSKYRLSAKACQGILNRAERRGKELPPELKAALVEQSAFKNEPESLGGGKGILIQPEHTGALSTFNNQSVLPQPYGIGAYNSEGMKSDNPHSGIYKADTARTLDLTGGSPACNQGGVAIVTPIEGNGTRESHKGNGYGVADDPMFTLNGTEQHAVAAVDVYNQTIEGSTAPTVTAAVGGANTSGPKVMSYAVDCRNGTENECVNGTLQAKEQGQNLNSNNVVRQKW